MTEVRKSGTIYKCRRCLKRPNETYREDPNEVLAICAECGTENWCLPVGKEKGAAKAKKVVEAAETEVAESTPEVSMEDPQEPAGQAYTDEGLEAESVTEAISEADEDPAMDVENYTDLDKETERETLLARLAKLDAEETE